MYDDPIVEEVRETRERLSEKHNFDIGAIFEDLRQRQAKLGKRLVHLKRKKVTAKVTDRDQNSITLHPGR